MGRQGVGELVTFATDAGRELDGIYYDPEGGRRIGTIIHIHGSFGNFYHNKFVRIMAAQYQLSGLAFLSFNLSCHDGLAEGYVGVDDFEYVGGAVTGFNTVIGDIDAAVGFARSRLQQPVVLQGHSLGCDRVLFYLVTKAIQQDFILLSPCDSYALQAKWIAPETMEQQMARLARETSGAASTISAAWESKYLEKSAKALDWVPLREYGIATKDWSYPIPITRGALLEVLTGPVFRLLRLDKADQFRVPGRGLVYIGGADSIQTSDAEVMFRHIEERTVSIRRVFVAEGDHGLTSCEALVARAAAQWCTEVLQPT